MSLSVDEVSAPTALRLLYIEFSKTVKLKCVKLIICRLRLRKVEAKLFMLTLLIFGVSVGYITAGGLKK